MLEELAYFCVSNLFYIPNKQVEISVTWQEQRTLKNNKTRAKKQTTVSLRCRDANGKNQTSLKRPSNIGHSMKMTMLMKPLTFKDAWCYAFKATHFFLWILETLLLWPPKRKKRKSRKPLKLEKSKRHRLFNLNHHGFRSFKNRIQIFSTLISSIHSQ